MRPVPKSSRFKVSTLLPRAFHNLRVGHKLLRDCPEKFLKAVAQAFQPVRINAAGETPALRAFYNFWLGLRTMKDCSEKLL
jgi:hypothetical protein